MKKRALIIMTAALLSISLVACGATDNKTESNSQETTQETTQEATQKELQANQREANDIIEDMILYYGSYESQAKDKIASLLDELRETDANKASQWEEIMNFWEYAHEEMEINSDVLPDGLDDSDKLCIVVLGYQLNADGSMQDELIGRLKVALESAKKYPNAYVACTGGGTAENNPDVTEADQMANWLIENGLDKERLIVENKSSSTVENAQFTYNILRENYPDIDSIAIVTSDYHVQRGSLLYKAQLVLSAAENNDKPIEIVSNAAYQAHKEGGEPFLWQAGGLCEILGDVDLANNIYDEKYDVPKLDN